MRKWLPPGLLSFFSEIMPRPLWRRVNPRGKSLDELFYDLVEEGLTSADALEKLTERIRSSDIEPPLPEGWHLKASSSGVVVRTPSSSSYSGNKFCVLERRGVEYTPDINVGTRQLSEQHSVANEKLNRRMTRNVINRKGWANLPTAEIARLFENSGEWVVECAENDVDPRYNLPPKRDTINRVLGRRLH